MKSKFLFVLPLAMSLTAFADTAVEQSNALDELDPMAANIEETLLEMDEAYEQATGMSATLEKVKSSSCYQRTCAVFLDVNKATQKAELFVDGAFVREWKISSGLRPHNTPNFDKHPDGRIYTKYSSTKYPGGSYNGLGNMPYAVFIKGGFAVHGTTTGNFPKLGTPASHGCIRMHPDNAKVFNELVRANGIMNTWITVR